MGAWENYWKGKTGQQRHAFDMKVFAALGGQDNGAENMDLLMAGRLRLRLEEVVETFFDGTSGRRIPHQGMKGVVDAHPDFRLAQSAIVYAERLARITRHLADGKEFISVTEFERRSCAVLEELGSSKQTANLRKCPYFPFALPQMPIADYGTTLDEVVLPAVGRAYLAQFPDRRFENYRKSTLAGQVTVVEGSRHDRLVEALGKGAVCGVYFPCLQGFPLDLAVEQMQGLPDEFLLAGAIDISAVEIMYPDVVARNYNTPGLDCAALRWRGRSLYFGAYGGDLSFSHRFLDASDSCAGGLVVLG